MKTIETADEYLSGKEKGIKQRSKLRYELGKKQAQKRDEAGSVNENTMKVFLNRSSKKESTSE